MKRTTASVWILPLLIAAAAMAGCAQVGNAGAAHSDASDAWVRPEPAMVQGEPAYVIPADVQQAAVPIGAAVFLESGVSFSITEASSVEGGLRTFSLEIVNGSGDPIDDTMIPVPALIDTVSGEEQPGYRDSAASIGSDFIGPVEPGEYAAFSLAYTARDAGREFGVRVSLPTGQAVIFEPAGRA